MINYELPDVPETYVHRIGRTGRAGASGIAIAFRDAEEKVNLKDIQKLIGIQIPIVTDHPYAMSNISLTNFKPISKQPQQQRNHSQRRSFRGGDSRRYASQR